MPVVWSLLEGGMTVVGACDWRTNVAPLVRKHGKHRKLCSMNLKAHMACCPAGCKSQIHKEIGAEAVLAVCVDDRFDLDCNKIVSCHHSDG